MRAPQDPIEKWEDRCSIPLHSSTVLRGGSWPGTPAPLRTKSDGLYSQPRVEGTFRDLILWELSPSVEPAVMLIPQVHRHTHPQLTGLGSLPNPSQVHQIRSLPGIWNLDLKASTPAKQGYLNGEEENSGAVRHPFYTMHLEKQTHMSIMNKASFTIKVSFRVKQRKRMKNGCGFLTTSELLVSTLRRPSCPWIWSDTPTSQLSPHFL